MTRLSNARWLASSGAAGWVAAVAPAAAHPHVFVTSQATVIYENGAITGLRQRWVFDEMYTASAVEGLDKNNDGKLDKAELEELTQVNIEGLKEFDYFTTVTLGGKPLEVGTPREYFMEVVAGDDPPGPRMMLEPADKAAKPTTGAVAGLGPSSSGQSTPGPATSGQPPGLWSRMTSTIGGWWSRLTGRGATPAMAVAPAQQASPPDTTQLLAITFTLPLKVPVPATTDGFQFMVNDGQMFIAFEMAGKDPILISPGAPAGCAFKLGEPELDEQQKRLQDAFGRVGGMAMPGAAKVVTMSCPKP